MLILRKFHIFVGNKKIIKLNMKKLTTSVLIVVLSSSLGMVGAQTKPKKDTLKETAIGEVVITGAMGRIFVIGMGALMRKTFLTGPHSTTRLQEAHSRIW